MRAIIQILKLVIEIRAIIAQIHRGDPQEISNSVPSGFFVVEL